MARVPRSVLRRPGFGGPAPPLQLFQNRGQRVTLLIQPEDLAHPLGLLWVDHQSSAARVHIVAQYGVSAGPLALAPGGGHLVARALADNLPLELRKRQQYVEREPPQRSGGIELLGDRDE